jgi:hypothetical protein
LLSDLLVNVRSTFTPGLRLRIVDATSITRGGKTGTDHRLHVGIDLGSNRIDAIELTDVKGAETLERFAVRSGEILIADRGYAKRRGMEHVVRQGGLFVVRLAWGSVPLQTVDGQPFALFDALRSLPEARAGEFPVRFLAPDGTAINARLVAIRKSEPAAGQARQTALRQRSKKGNASVDLRTLEAAGYLFVLTNLPTQISPEGVLDLYRLRWQIEMKFKTLKSVLHLDNVSARSDEGLRVYVFAKLLVALLIDALFYDAESISPWGYPLAPAEPLAGDEAPARCDRNDDQALRAADHRSSDPTGAMAPSHHS